jgi:hypothetical protein
MVRPRPIYDLNNIADFLKCKEVCQDGAFNRNARAARRFADVLILFKVPIGRCFRHTVARDFSKDVDAFLLMLLR